MNVQIMIDLFMTMIYVTAELSLPLLTTALAIGLLVSIFQAATQINEATLTFLPKIAAMIAVFILIAPWMTKKLTDYTQTLYNKIPEIVRMQTK